MVAAAPGIAGNLTTRGSHTHSVLVDPKVRHFGLYRGAALVTPNQLEAEQATGLRIRDPRDLREVGRRILRTLRCDAALVTRGEHGMALFRTGEEVVEIKEAFDFFDIDGSGEVSVREFVDALRSYGFNTKNPEIYQMIADMDEDGKALHL